MIRPADYLVEERGFTTPCWIWQRVTSKGYGMYVRAGEREGAHRRSYRQHRGEIPDGLELDHLCRVALCIRPDHLEPVTHVENVRRGRRCTLTSSDVAAIRASDESSSVLGDRYGVTRSQIWRVRTGRQWLLSDAAILGKLDAA